MRERQRESRREGVSVCVRERERQRERDREREGVCVCVVLINNVFLISDSTTTTHKGCATTVEVRLPLNTAANETRSI